MKTNKVRHHYIPRFLLRPFCYENDLLHFYDKRTKTIKTRKISETFMEPNLYRDSFNNPDNPIKLENDFAKYEGEVAKIIAKFRDEDKDEIVLSIKELEALKLFLALMPFRAADTGELFGDNDDPEFKDFYSKYNKEGDLRDFWKRNMEYIVQCRSYKEVSDNSEIAKPIKVALQRDLGGPYGSSFVIAERRGQDEFIFGDVFPTKVNMVMRNREVKIPMFFFVPLSPNRMLILVSDIIKTAPNYILGFDKKIFNLPKKCNDLNEYRHKVGRLYSDDVRKINAIIADSSIEGFILHDEENISVDRLEEDYLKWKESNGVALI